MQRFADSTDRAPKEYVLFALACVGALVGIYGIVLSASFLAICGLLVLVWGAYVLVRQPDP
jgi:hypothetical protein